MNESYQDMPLPQQLEKITAERDHAPEIAKIGDRWLAEYKDLVDSGATLMKDSSELNGSWGDANGDRFKDEAYKSAKTVIGWAEAISAVMPWVPVRALVAAIPPVFQKVEENAKKAEELMKELEGLMSQTYSDASVLGGPSPLSEATARAEAIAEEIKRLQREAGVLMDGLGAKYTDLAATLQNMKGPDWAGPVPASSPGISGPSAPPGAPPVTAQAPTAGPDAAAGPAAGPAGGPAGSPAGLAGGAAPAAAPPGGVPSPFPGGGAPSPVPGGGVVPPPLVPGARPPSTVRPPVKPRVPSSDRSGVPGVVSPIGARGRSGHIGGVPGVRGSGIPQAAVVRPATEVPVNGAAPAPAPRGGAAAGGATGTGTPMFPPPAGGAGVGAGAAGTKPGRGNAQRQPKGRGRLPERTPGLPKALGGRAGKLDPRSVPQPKGRAVVTEETPLDDELWSVNDVPKPLAGERRLGH